MLVQQLVLLEGRRDHNTAEHITPEPVGSRRGVRGENSIAKSKYR